MPGWRGNGDGAARTLARALVAPPFRTPLAVAGVAFIAAALLDRQLDLPLLCGASDAVIDHPGAIAQLVWTINAPDRIALAWLVMLVAMMTPLMAVPLARVRDASLTSRRTRAAAGFVFGYFGSWFLFGLPLVAGAIVVRLVADSGAFATALGLALLWSASPATLAAQNRAHRVSRIGLFGWRADRDCIGAGIVHGGWCFASCWPWMLVSLTATQFHVAVMLAVTAIIFAERLSRPRAPAWHRPALLMPLVALAGRIGRPAVLIERYE